MPIADGTDWQLFFCSRSVQRIRSLPVSTLLLNMRSTHWNRKRLAIAGLGLIILYILLSSGYHDYQIDTLINNCKPEAVWEYVADFSKMRLLNPTISDFKVTADEGNRDHWRYSVVYHEKLSHWPYWKSVAYGDIAVIKALPGQSEFYSIESKHKTCFLAGIYCLLSSSEFKFSSLGTDTYCVEKVSYQCPPFLSSACRRELEHQRKAVMHNLTSIFSKSRQDSN